MMIDGIEAINVRLPLLDDKGFYTVTIRDGKFTAVERQENFIVSPVHKPIGQLGFEELKTAAWLDMEGKAMLPGFVDAHMHLDKAYSLPWVRNRTGTLLEAIVNYRSVAPSFTKEVIRERIVKASLRAASYGSAVLRSHLDVPVHLGRDIAMRTIEAALEAREIVNGALDIQYFPIFYFDQAKEREWTDFAAEALRIGIDGVGGAPHLSPDPQASLAWAFKLATAFDKPVDLHTDESDDPSVKTIEVYCEHAERFGYAGRATAGHLCSLSAMEQDEAERLIARMAECGIAAVTLPAVNLYLQGRGDRGNVRRGVTRVRELLEAGVLVAAASDNIQDPFHPFGRGDMLQNGLMTAYAAHMAREEDIGTVLRMLTSIPAAITGVADYGIAPGNPARFVVLDAVSAEELLQELPAGRWVYNKAKWTFASRFSRSGFEAAMPEEAASPPRAVPTD
ncbi:cytosine deaminase [Paenibacillus phyllosphaerae]|uniref:Cytosine deaminase n=1 Tax=Paenibacillus phyllosphaerae TaxID=274593 RepID=A0A7W5FNY0_9BACL|nr:amidohydrolase family protein [Paenibacillus phyllosphaerae]MBB3111627.1 cytosine deaminase [Paenibacillus phyllosphaerae]